MSDTISTAARTLSLSVVNEMHWLQQVLDARNSDAQEDLYDIAPPAVTDDLYGQLIQQHELGFNERFILALALAPHFRPDLLEMFRRNEDRPAIFGGYYGKNHRGFIPTGETALFVLAGKDVARRMKLEKIFDRSHPFHTDDILRIDSVAPGEPRLSGMLFVTADFIDQVVYGKKVAPAFTGEFPARLLTTGMEWDDMVLGSNTKQQLKEIEIWLEFNHVLMNGWGLGKMIRPGFKALFHGPPGTGKSLTAALLGKKTGRDVYRIDLSMIVSKYIGETEKNLARIFDRAEHKDWILFFDEADALFGKRTSVSSSHDKYANQEVSYLLQRIEEYSGLVILASNLRNNIDDAFTRRFNSIIYYPLPRPEERLRIWQNSFSSATPLSEKIDLNAIAQKYEMSGGHIVNVVHYCSLMAASRADHTILPEDILEGIRKEFGKMGRTI